VGNAAPVGRQVKSGRYSLEIVQTLLMCGEGLVKEKTDFELARKRLTRRAWWITGAYALTLCLLSLMVFFGAYKSRGFTNMKPNEVGDLLAGIAGPFAFIWLVYGYFLQGIAIRQQAEELFQNTEALKLQAKQLSLLVEAENAQKEMMRESQSPHFQINFSRWQGGEFSLRIMNSGAPVSNLVVTGSDGFGNFQDRSCSALGRNEILEISNNMAIPRYFDSILTPAVKYWVSIQYECANGLIDRRIYDHDDEPHTQFGRFVLRKPLTTEEKS
jgi:hypothetical protein